MDGNMTSKPKNTTLDYYDKDTRLDNLMFVGDTWTKFTWVHAEIKHLLDESYMNSLVFTSSKYSQEELFEKLQKANELTYCLKEVYDLLFLIIKTGEYERACDKAMKTYKIGPEFEKKDEDDSNKPDTDATI